MSDFSVGVDIESKADLTELREAIAAYDGTTESLQRLKNAAGDVKSETNELVKAQSTYTRAQRANTFELRQSLRFVRAGVSLFRGLNQVLQLTILRQVASNTEMIKQQRLFEDIITTVPDFAKIFELPKVDPDRIAAIEDFLGSLKDLSPAQMEQVASALERTAEAKVDPSLQRLIREIRLMGKDKSGAEASKNIQDMMTSIFQIAQVGIELASFVTMLKILRGGALPGVTGLTTMFTAATAATAALTALSVILATVGTSEVANALSNVERAKRGLEPRDSPLIATFRAISELLTMGKISPEILQNLNLLPPILSTQTAFGETPPLNLESRFAGSSRLGMQTQINNFNFSGANFTLASGLDLNRFVDVIIRKMQEKQRAGVK